MFQVNTNHLLAALICCANEDLRYYLNGVLIETTKTGNGFMVGTDGHRMLVCRFDLPKDHQESRQFIIPREALAALRATVINSEFQMDEFGDEFSMPTQAKPSMICEGEIQYGDLEIRFKPIDGKFPDWRKVVPNGEFSGVGGSFDLTLMDGLRKVGQMLVNPASAKMPTCLHNGRLNSIVCVWDHEPDAVCILMPLRLDAAEFPAWAAKESTMTKAK